jgi:type IV secretory pathway TrbL component
MNLLDNQYVNEQLSSITAMLSLGLKAAVSVAFLAWAIRRKNELDYVLSKRAKLIRWCCFLGFLLLILIPGNNFAAVRVIGWIISTAFLAWPNFAYHIDELINRMIKTNFTQQVNEEDKEQS